MKKIQKNDLRLEKEVIAALTSGDLSGIMGGVETTIKPPSASQDSKCESLQGRPCCFAPSVVDQSCKCMPEKSVAVFTCSPTVIPTKTTREDTCICPIG